ncbi:MAG: GspH/FimT family pseudopilin [Methyloprofundus sp.]|uniref:GspH/FimT family pseudopilin n=1 Tax=Methyloprofundus sp. TaxID=2020875 RepID=UPI002624B23B|nr:GspH/FimT family pseudopilin [Methyloprofundus sp.]
MGIINKTYRSSADYSPLLDCSQSGGLKSALYGRGFTLVELLLVIVIIALAAAVAAPNIGSGNQTASLNAAAREISSALRFARGHALTHRKEAVVMLNLEDNSYQITDRSKKYKVAKDIAVSLDVAQSQIIDQDHGGVRFFSDGSSTGGRITLEIGENKRQIDINWLTGQVEIDDY